MKYLQDKGFRVIPVNPQAVGQEILGEKVYAISRRPRQSTWSISSAAPDAAGRSSRMRSPRRRVVWMQLGVRTTRRRRGPRPPGSSRHEPLPQDRISAGSWRTRLERRQYRHALQQAQKI